MKFASPLLFAGVLTLASLSFGEETFSLTNTLHIGGAGRWDYVTVDPANHTLYITRSTHTQVIDPASGKVIADIAGGEGLHGVALAPSANRGFISDGKAAELIAFDLKTNAVLGKIAAADDVDGIIYDAGTDRVLASCGDAGQLITLDPKADIATAKVEKIDLDGKPEFLAADEKGKAFVCINDKNLIAVVDVKQSKVTDRWSLGTGTGPAGIAIDAKNGRLYVGCRNEKLIILNTADGKVLAEVPIGKGNDACVFDPETGEAFASCGDSTTSVVKETQPGTFTVTQTVKTKQGARTIGLDPTTHTLYLPSAEFDAQKAPGKRWPAMKPDTFQILVVSTLAK